MMKTISLVAAAARYTQDAAHKDLLEALTRAETDFRKLEQDLKQLRLDVEAAAALGVLIDK